MKKGTATARVTLRLPKGLKAEVASWAKRQGVSLNRLLVVAIEHYREIAMGRDNYKRWLASKRRSFKRFYE